MGQASPKARGRPPRGSPEKETPSKPGQERGRYQDYVGTESRDTADSATTQAPGTTSKADWYRVVDEVQSLVSFAQLLRALGGDPGRKGRTRGICHDGSNPQAFRYSESLGVWHCYACDIGGHKIQLVQRVKGHRFIEALHFLADLAGVSLNSYRPLPREKIIEQRADRNAIAAADVAFNTWKLRTFNHLVAEYWEILAEIETAEIAYRATCRRPDLYTDDEQSYWITRLSRLYDRREILNNQLDFLTRATTDEEEDELDLARAQWRCEDLRKEGRWIWS